MSQTLTVKEAIEQGYTLYGYDSADGGFQSLHSIDGLSAEDFEEFTDMVLAEKEPHYVGVNAIALYQDIIEDLMCSEDCLGDDTVEIDDLVKTAVDWDDIAAKINAALKTRPYYRLTEIKLIP